MLITLSKRIYEVGYKNKRKDYSNIRNGISRYPACASIFTKFD